MNCLECKHLIYDKTAYAQARLNNDTKTNFESYCYPINGMWGDQHTIEFLNHTLSTIHPRITHCEDFEPIEEIK